MERTHCGDGNFYGVTSGGSSNDGTIFTITTEGTLTTLFEAGSSNRFPELSLESDGLFYGTFLAGGTNREGTIFTITSGASGSGKGTVTYTVPANATTNALTGTITVAGQTFTVRQAGAK